MIKIQDIIASSDEYYEVEIKLDAKVEACKFKGFAKHKKKKHRKEAEK